MTFIPTSSSVPSSVAPPILWFSVEDGQQAGPWSVVQLRERVDSGVITNDTLLWNERMTDWLPLGLLISSANSPFAGGSVPQDPGLIATDRTGSGEPPAVAPRATQASLSDRDSHSARSTSPRPWHRWFARLIDLWCTAILLGVVLGATGHAALAENQIGFTMMSALLLVGLESLLLASIGNTLGKALLNIRVTEHDGRGLTALRALRRALNVWLSGEALGFPIANLITMSRQHQELKRNGITTYDDAGSYMVTHGEVGVGRVIGLITAAALIITIMAIGAAA